MKILTFLKNFIKSIKRKRDFKKRIKQMTQHDPFIYK
jgi:hypothetical protein